jgi:hypothetical protein
LVGDNSRLASSTANTWRLPSVDRHGDPHRLADDDPGLAHLLVASRIRYGNGSFSRRSAQALRASSNDLLIALIDESEKLWPHNDSVTAFTWPKRGRLQQVGENPVKLGLAQPGSAGPSAIRRYGVITGPSATWGQHCNSATPGN